MHERKYDIEREGPNQGRIVKRKGRVPIPDDEPLFVFRAKDRKALAALTAYSMILDNLEQKAQVKKSIDDFRDFQEKYPDRMKEPDL